MTTNQYGCDRHNLCETCDAVAADLELARVSHLDGSHTHCTYNTCDPLRRAVYMILAVTPEAEGIEWIALGTVRRWEAHARVLRSPVGPF